MLGLVLFCSLQLALNAPAAEVVEEVVAVVGGSPILASDVELAALLGLLPPVPHETPAEHRRRIRERVVDLEVQFRDLESTGALHRLQLPTDEIVAGFAAVRGGPDALDRQLDAAGYAEADLRRLATRVAAVQAHVEQQLRPRVRVGEHEVEAAYEALVAELGPDVAPPPLAEVRPQLERIVAERELNREIERWVEQARARIRVSRPDPAGTGPGTHGPSPGRAPRTPGWR